MPVVASVNVNGIRAAARRGMPAWLTARRPDVLLLQEVRADAATLQGNLGDAWYVAAAEAAAKGRAGVAVASREPLTDVRVGLPGFEADGRWVEAVVQHDGAPAIRYVSVYVHSGEAGTAKQENKMRFLDAVRARLAELLVEDRDGRATLWGGDVNIGHRELDIRNHRGNRGKAGFLPEERRHLTELYESGWTDVGRHLAGEVEGPYTWWSWRGQAFDNDTGWRIDLQVASPSLAARSQWCEVDRAATYAERFSDHAPLVAGYR